MRELSEEIGITDQPLISLGLVTHTNKIVHFYVVIVEMKEYLDSDEMVDNKWYDIEDASFIVKMLPGDEEIIAYIQKNKDLIFNGGLISQFNIFKDGVDIARVTNKI